METEAAIETLAALAQPTRLEAFRLLVRNEPDGVPAGELARALSVPQNTLSAHLTVLAHAEARARRAERAVRSSTTPIWSGCAQSRSIFSKTAAARARRSARRSPQTWPHVARVRDRRGGRGHDEEVGAMGVIIYHNPACGTSRNTLGLIRNADVSSARR